MSKYWKEASSIILAARHSFPRNAADCAKKGLAVRKVDSLSKNSIDTDNKFKIERLNKSNFKVLALRRSSKTSFLPDNYVFPGGNVDLADSSKDWLEVFNQCGFDKDSFETNTFNTKINNKINIYEDQSKNEIIKSISLRITGIRETFEESGILLCKNKHDPVSPSSRWASYLTGHEIQEWQKKVQGNAYEFINLCRHFECCPDIWCLQEWSNWLSPPSFPKRFNTIFFIATLDQIPPTSSSSTEVNDIKWSTSEELLDLCNKQKILLPPPQFYELSRLVTFADIDQLGNFVSKKYITGCELWMPLRIKMTDGEITLFPGDDMYPTEPVFTQLPMQEMKDTVMEYRKQSHRLHRMEHTEECNTRLVVRNITFNQNDVVPWIAPF